MSGLCDSFKNVLSVTFIERTVRKLADLIQCKRMGSETPLNTPEERLSTFTLCMCTFTAADTSDAPVSLNQSQDHNNTMTRSQAIYISALNRRGEMQISAIGIESRSTSVLGGSLCSKFC